MNQNFDALILSLLPNICTNIILNNTTCKNDKVMQ